MVETIEEERVCEELNYDHVGHDLYCIKGNKKERLIETGSVDIDNVDVSINENNTQMTRTGGGTFTVTTIGVREEGEDWVDIQNVTFE